MSRFRDRVGWQAAFLEDGVMQGLLLARGRRGQSQRIKAAAIQEAQERMNLELAERDRLQAARLLVGPRRGLPALKDDLTRLALLLHLPVNPKDTVAQLQEKIKPSIEMLKNVAPAKAASQAAPKAKSLATPQASSPESTESSWLKPSTVADEQMAQLTALSQKLQQQVKDQEGRFNLMMEQVMQAVQQGPLLPQALEVDADMPGAGPSS